MAEAASNEAKQPMTDEERAALCEKLDKELDDFIDGLEKKRYTEGWPEDKWEEEMDKHPFFMKSTPDDGSLSPLAEGLAKLKYDPEENTPAELAAHYKEDGNFNYKHKNYRLAILGYTEGIKQRCDDAELNASLYNNRAACHWYLKNYRSALFDSEKALSFNPNHAKARLRAAKSAFTLGKFEVCTEHSHKIMDSHKQEANELLNSSKLKKILRDRDQRKAERRNENSAQQRSLLIKTIKERGIKIFKCEDEDDIDLYKLVPELPGAQDAVVHIENGILMWPILFLYPEYRTSDFVRDCPENVSLQTQLEQIFPAPWDLKHNYSCSRVNVYFEGVDKMPHIIDISKTLGEVLVENYYELKDGTPAFFVLRRGSHREHIFLESYEIVRML